ncbi:MAG: protein kinase [Acidobacteriota bacterium]|nr:protein kinase [Blastocatellia bacterium]MDW8411852.1 protein kinase [Acidobacteriota bacterium]
MLFCPACKTKYDEPNRRRCVNDFTPLEEFAEQDEPSLLAGRYRIIRKIGAGGMAVVFLAERVHIGDLAAVKVMNRSVAGRPEALAQFEAEARLAAAASHPNVVQIYDFGVKPDGLPYLVMEYIEGPTLAEELKQYGTFSIERALEVFQPICSAVAAAHAGGLIHRDLKPSNVILQRLKGGAEVVKVLDFGIATEQALSTETAAVGTLGYMSLEQVRGEKLDQRSDIYSLAVIFYEMLTAQLPYPATTATQLLVSMARQNPVPLKSLRPDLPSRLEAVLNRALSRERKERPSSALQLYNELAEAVCSRTIQIPKSKEKADTLAQPIAVTTAAHPAVTVWLGEAGTLNLECCIGREREIQMLCSELDSPSMLPVLILSEPGVGKTRLLTEYQSVTEAAGVTVLNARFYDYGGSQLAPYQVFLDMLRACLLGERPSSAAEASESSQKLTELAQAIQTHTGIVLPELAFNAAGLAGSTDKWKLFEALMSIYRRLARGTKLVFIFDDLHFADSLSLELIAYIVRNRADAQIQIVASALLEEAKSPSSHLSEWLCKQIGRSGYREMLLQGIPRERASEFMAAVFGQIEIADRELDYLWQETQGVPLYLVELIEHLILSSRIIKDENVWRVKWLGELQVPPSVSNLINAKLRNYDPDVQEVLRHAAVIGDTFDFDTLAATLDMQEELIEEALEEGLRGWLLKRAGADEFSFRNSLIRRALYNSMAIAERRKVHSSVAEAIARSAGKRIERIAGQVAYHYFYGGQWVKAIKPAFSAAEVAHKREAFDEAARYYRYAIEAAEQLPEHQQTDSILERSYVGLAESLVHLGKLDEGERVIAKLYELAGKRRDACLRAWGELLASRLNHFRGNLKRAVELARLGLESITEAGKKDVELYRRILQQLGYTLCETGEIAEATEYMQRAVEVATEGPEPRLAGWALSWLGLMNAFQGNSTLGLQQGERSLEMLRSLGDRVSELLALERLGIICGTLGEMDRAAYYFESGLKLATTIGYRVQQSRLLANLGEVYRLTGELRRAEQHYEQALQLARQLEQEDIESNCLQNLGHVAVARKDYHAGIELLDKALEMLRQQNRRMYEPEVYCSLGTAYAGLGDTERALKYYKLALQLSREMSLADVEWKSLYGIALLMENTDKTSAANTIAEALKVIDRMRTSLPTGTNLKSFEQEKQPVYELDERLKAYRLPNS